MFAPIWESKRFVLVIFSGTVYSKTSLIQSALDETVQHTLN